jgi:hypothetical protein
VILLGELVPILLVAAIVLVARRYSASDKSKDHPRADRPTPTLPSRLVIDAIKPDRTLQRTDLKTAKEAVDQKRAG